MTILIAYACSDDTNPYSNSMRVNAKTDGRKKFGKDQDCFVEYVSAV